MNIAIIILAAGASRRFGTGDKLLADVAGEPIVAGLIRRMAAVRVKGAKLTVHLVVPASKGGLMQAVAEISAPLRPAIVVNPRAEVGMGTSIAVGVASLSADTEAAVIVPGDMPTLGTALIERLITAHLIDGAQRPTHPCLPDGRKVGPVVWPRALFPALVGLDGDSGGRGLLDRVPTHRINLTPADCDDLADVDTPGDLARVRATVGKPAGT